MKRHHFYYFFIFVIFVAGIIAISALNFSKSLQIAMFIFLALAYVFFGMVHHRIHHTITSKIVIEYIAIATLGISLVVFVLQGVSL